MARISNLPSELLEAVALECSDTKSLRLTNRHIYAAVEHVLWKTRRVNLYLDSRGLSEGSIQMLEDFKTGCKGSESIRMLHITSPDSYHALGHSKLSDSDLLSAAIRAMRGLRSVEWRMRWKGLRSTLPLPDSVVFDALSFLPLLQELNLWCRSIPSFSFDQLHGGQLKKLTIFGEPTAHHDLLSSLSQWLASNPQLSDLRLTWTHVIGISPPSLLPFSTLFDVPLAYTLSLRNLDLTRWIFDFDHPSVTRHLRNLQSLDLALCEYDDKGLWKFLSAEQISLRRIRVQKISSEMFDYLESIAQSGVEELLLTEFPEPSGSQELARRFYEHVLPRHCRTLRTLCIEPASRLREWLVGTNDANTPIICTELTELTVGLHCENGDDRLQLLMSFILNLTDNVPRLEHLILALPAPSVFDLDADFVLDGMIQSLKLPSKMLVPAFDISVLPWLFKPYLARVTEDGVVFRMDKLVLEG
ncbi:hypothetical protein PQX77_017866 [Marasmius sp. AFHP31]|nr:hypothetical protein PQX77_017866 [Marasmius sp. AFHP31]